MAQNNDGPGKRLKREEAKNTLYVDNPSDKRLQAYQDSLGLYNKNETLWKDYKQLTPSIAQQIKTSFQPGLVYKKRNNPNLPGYDVVFKDVVKKPERPVVLINRKKSEPIEPLQPRQSVFATPEIISPVMRPVSVPEPTNMEEPMEAVIEEKPLVRKLPKAVMPQRQGGWGNQSLFMRAFPNLFAK